MVKAMRKTLMLSTVLLIASGTAQANINASLKTVCTNAQSDTNQQVDRKVDADKKRYQARLASFYKGVTCNGQALLTHKVNKPKHGGGTIAERRLLK